ncbi:peptidyl-prolyl cis-trans isomerase G-like isoform X2 [Linepithema humile]|uniref:peptidyl-prolyl cis-trans isomerase G-like isoform X2 n=1 Tax=Linepithema humile TaxID=83485 RepID=UPI00351EEF20
MNFDKKSLEEEMRSKSLERRNETYLRRKKWHLEQQLQQEHEELKREKIKEYERKRVEALRNQRRFSQRRKSNTLQRSKSNTLQRSKSNTPQRRKTLSTDSEHSKDFEILKYSKDTIIDQKELHKIKRTIHRQFDTKDQITSEKIEWDIDDLNKITLLRRTDEGSCPIFKNINAAQAREIEETHREEQSVISKKQLPTDIDTRKYSADERDLQSNRSRRSIKYQDERRITNNYEHQRRYRSRSKSREEKDKNKKRDRSHSSRSSHGGYSSYRRRRSRSNHCSNSVTSIVKDRSSYHRRSKSSSPMSRYVRAKRIDNYTNQSSFQPLSRSLFRSPSRSSSRSSSKNDLNKSYKRNDRASSDCPIPNLPIFPSTYNLAAYNRFLPGPSQMLPPPMIWTRPYPMQYPVLPSPMIRWPMPPPRFVNNNRGAYYPR